MPDDTDKTLDGDPSDEDDAAQKPASRPRKAGPRPKPPVPSDLDDDSDLPVAPPRSSGGSGAVWVAIILIVVAALVAGVWWKHWQDSRAAEARKQKELAALSSQLGVVQNRIGKALRDLDQSEPDVEGAIDSLNKAAEGIVMAATPSGSGVASDVADKLVRLQGDIRTASQGLEQDKSEYEKKIKAAREDLRSAATRRVRPIVDGLRLVGTSLGSSPSQPVPATVLAPTPPGLESAPAPTGAAPAAPATTTPAPGTATGTAPTPAAPAPAAPGSAPPSPAAGTAPAGGQ